MENNKEFDFRKLLESTQKVQEADTTSPEEDRMYEDILNELAKTIADDVAQAITTMKGTMEGGWKFRGPGFVSELIKRANQAVKDATRNIQFYTPEEKAAEGEVQAEVKRRLGKKGAGPEAE